jgi:VWFA-related protein
MTHNFRHSSFLHNSTHPKPSRRAALSTLLAAPSLLAQDPVIKVDVQLVNVTYTVRNKQGGLVGNLSKDDFTLFEDGKPQEIRNFQLDTDLPLTIGLLLDISGSMYNIIESGRGAAAQFFRQVLRPKDLAFLISFASEMELVQDLTSSASLLERGLREVKPVRPTRVMTQGPVPTTARGTRLYDAVYLAAEEKLKTEAGRKVIVLLTDGADQGSVYKPAEALKQAHLADCVIYSLFYYEPYYGSDESALKKLSGDTGGRVIDVARRGNLELAYKQLQEEMRSQYSLAYSPTNSNRDGAFRKIEIKPRDSSLKVQARRGYYATAG